MTFGIWPRLRPQHLVRDRALLTGNSQRAPNRFGLEVTDPVSGAPFEVTVFQYPGPPGSRQLLAMHGFRGDHHGLELVVDGLSQYDAWVPDLPGFGASPAMPDAEHTVENLAHVVNQVADRLDAPALLGHSFGSVIAAHAVQQEAFKYRHLVLLNPIARPALAAQSCTDRTATAVTNGFYQVAATLPTALGRRLLSNRLIVWATGAFMTKTDDPRILAYTHDQHQAYFSAFDSPKVLLEAYRASIEHTVSDVAPALKLPVTIIGGDGDELSSPEDIAALADHIGRSNNDVETHILQRTGHLLHYERSAAAAALITWRL
ncbi:alpha/beta fold hydrolase [Yaniella halotolerans]|uniref:alpha/beta fold hydrolase n=1 Tax=Yaniella halotolerans TaxID=225453 RepID=UPI0003B4938F|nr:alpha/beta hydrolase [Yaniella halotolerans]